MLSPVRLSSVCRLQHSCTLRSRLKFSAMFLRHLVPWPPVDIHRNFTEIVPGKPGMVKRKRVVKYSDSKIAIFDLSKAISRKRCKIGGKLVLITNRKLHMSFRLVPKLVTLNDQRRNGPYFALFRRIPIRCRRKSITSVFRIYF